MKNSSCRVLLVALVLALGAASAVWADYTRIPIPWSTFGTWNPQTYNGIPARDYESTGGCADPTKGPAAFSSETDIASGGAPYLITNCNPQVNATDNCCGSQTSTFWAYWDGPDSIGNFGTVAGDYIALRMRINGDPRDSDRNCLSNSHWNFLLSTNNNPGFKDWWIDVFGNDDRIRILYEDAAAQQLSNDDLVNGLPVYETWINELALCAVGAATTGVARCDKNNTENDCYFSHARVCGATGAGDLAVGYCSTTSTDGTGEWYVDVQVPIDLLTDSTGNFTLGPPRHFTPGAAILTGPTPAQLGVFFSTSDSSTDPLQKDFVADCVSVNGPCSFGETTPVTVSYFRAERRGGGVAFDWSTGTETGNVGFDIYVDRGEYWQKVTAQPVESKNPFSVGRLDYTLEVPGLTGETFKIVDMDIRGQKRAHGPFTLEKSYGAREDVAMRDWAAIRAEAGKVAVSSRGGVRTASLLDLLVEADGIYRVTYEQLAAAGLNLAGVRSSDVAVTSNGEPVEIRVASEKVFGPGSYVEFVGQAATGIYTRTNVYRLAVNRQLAKRVSEVGPTTRPAPPVRTYLEKLDVNDDLHWSFAAPGSDPWYRDWIVTYKNAPKERTYTLTVDHLADVAGASVQMVLWGMTDWAQGPDHHAEVFLNGTEVADATFDGLSQQVIDVPLPAGLLVEGANTLKVRVPGDAGVDYEVTIVDRFGATYTRSLLARDGKLAFASTATSFEVDGFGSPQLVAYQTNGSGVSYLANLVATPSASGYKATFTGQRKSSDSSFFVAETATVLTPGLRPSQLAPALRTDPAQYLVIAHASFLGGIAPLVAARQAEGLTVKVVDVEQVYGEFGNGNFSPDAIRNYLRHAAERLGTEYVLFVGADTYDYLNNTGGGSISFVPTLYGKTDAIVRWAPVDGLFGDLDGDQVPELAIGRFPVHNAAELAAMVTKTLEYPMAPHQHTAVFAADGVDYSNDFAAMSEASIAMVPAHWGVQRAYIDTLGIAGARTALIGGINGGVAYTQYLGHSDSAFWSFSDLFTTADAMALTNVGLPTVVTQWGCWNTFYVEPVANSLADRFLTTGPAGAAAVMGPSALTAIDSDRHMSVVLAQELFAGDKTIGQAIVAAKRTVAAERPWMVDVIRGFTLMGDPALRINP